MKQFEKDFIIALLDCVIIDTKVNDELLKILKDTSCNIQYSEFISKKINNNNANIQKTIASIKQTIQDI